MNTIPDLPLRDGRRIPQLGFGTYQIAGPEAAAAVHAALDAGYRLFDTATIYRNEAEVGAALRSSAVPRAELCVTTKVWNDRHGFEPTLQAASESLRRLQLDYIDLYLIHWPVPQADRYVETWRALIKLQQDGLVRSIGVSNFTVPHLQRLVLETGVVPVVNQIELHPMLPQRELREFHARHRILTESWTPLGQGAPLRHATVAALAAKHRRTPAQVVLRWHLELGLVVIPKSATPARIRENAAVFDFHLDPADLAQLAALENGHRIGPDPATFA